MTNQNSPEIQPIPHHTINFKTTASSSSSITSATLRTSSYVRSIREKRPSHFALFILSIFPTTINVLYHVFIFIATLLAFPLLLLALAAARLLQLVRHGRGYDQAVKLKTLLRAWIRIGTWLILIAAVVIWVVLLVLQHGFNATHVTRFVKWVRLVCLISGVYFVVLSLTGFLFLLPRVPLESSSSGVHVPESITEIIECFFFLWVVYEVVERVPFIGRCRVHGVQLQRLIEIPILVLIGHDLITVTTHMVAWSTKRLVNRHLKPGVDTRSQWYLFVEELLLRQYLVYYTTGVRKSVSFILSSLLLLFTWVFYFGAKLIDAKDVIEFGKWTSFSLVICSLLWLIKSCILLSWEARAVYDRLCPRILEAGEALYFLGVVGRAKFDVLGLLYKDRRSKDGEEESNSDARRLRRRHLIWLYIVTVLGLVSVEKHTSRADQEEECWEEGSGRRKLMKMSMKKRKIVRDELLLLGKKGAQTLYNVQQVAQYILAAKGTLSREKFLCDIVAQFTADENNRDILERIVEWKPNANIASTLSKSEETEESQIDDWEYFEKLLKNVHPSEQVSFLKIEAWMEKAHSKCLRLANMLKSAKEVVDCLNKIMSGVIVSATFIMWLLLTGLATTKVFVLIASPLLAATFIFGDTCKTLFQGIVFIYMVHPFDVGDLCVVHDKLRVVKAIGVWKTIFSKVDSVGTREEVIYPNAELAKEIVINHKTEFDWDNWDYYKEFDLGSGSNTQVDAIKLKSDIENHLKEKEGEYNLIPSSHRVAVLAVGSKTKIAIRLKYKIDNTGDIQDWTYINCLQQKHNVQAQFDSFMHTFLDKFK